MAAALVRPSILLVPNVSARLHTSEDCEWVPVSCAPLPARCTPSWRLRTPVGERYKHIITSGPHTFKGDLSEARGAGGTAPEPKDYAFAGLAMCSSMTIRLFADRKKWRLRRITVAVKVSSKELRKLLWKTVLLIQVSILDQSSPDSNWEL